MDNPKSNNDTEPSYLIITEIMVNLYIDNKL